MNFNRLMFIVLSVFILIMVIGSVSATNDDLNDTLGLDDYSLLKDDVKSFSELQETLDGLGYDDDHNIVLQNDYKFDDSSDDKCGIKIYTDTVIDGNNHVIDGNNIGRFIEMERSASLTLKNCKIINCYSGDELSGGAIYNYVGGTLILENVTFENNKADRCGGAIYSDGDTTITDSTFKDNEALMGGACYLMCDSYSDDEFSYPIKNSKFIGNDAKSVGGAIVSEADNLALDIFDCEFIDNTAVYGGGAIMGTRNENNVIKNTNFTNNKALNYGGAISYGAVNVEDCSFKENSANHSSAIFAFYLVSKNSHYDSSSTIVTGKSSSIDSDVNTVIESDYRCLVDSEEYWTEDEYMVFYCTEPLLDVDFYSETLFTDDLSYLTNYYKKDDNILDKIKILFYLINEKPELFLNKRIDEAIKNNPLIECCIHSFVYDEDYIKDDTYGDKALKIRDEIMNIYDSGFRVPNKFYILKNGSRVDYDFKMSLSSVIDQNCLCYNQTVADVYNQSVVKEALTKKVKVGQDIKFRITVTNTGNQVLKEVFIDDSQYPEELIYKGYKIESGDWKVDEDKKTWTLKEGLKPEKSVSIILIFKVAKVGYYTNNVFTGFEDYEFRKASGSFEVTDQEDPVDSNNTKNNNNTKDNNNTKNNNKSDNNQNDKHEDKSNSDNGYYSDSHKVNISKANNTGNPILIVLLALLMVGTIFKSKK